MGAQCGTAIASAPVPRGLASKGGVCKARSGSLSQFEVTFSPPTRTGHEAASGALEQGQLVLRSRHSVDEVYDVDSMVIGKGSYGSVSRCTLRSTNAVRAIKTVPLDDDVLNEVRILRKMDHPNVVRLYETFEGYKRIELVMELCTGGDLRSRLKKVGRCAEVDAAVAMKQILRAVRYMHASGICHRDLKPANFLLLSKAPLRENTLKAIDFGYAFEFRTGGKMTDRMGSPYFMAPEVIHGPCYTEMCDMWSCGVMLYYMLTAIQPFYGRTSEDVIKNAGRGDCDFSSARWSGISDSAKDLAVELLQKKARRRCDAKMALAHPWIRSFDPADVVPQLNEHSLDRWREMQNCTRMMRASLHIIVSMIDDEQISSLRESFLAFDTDCDGFITAAELKAGLQRAGATAMPEDFNRILQGMDANQNGKLDYTEWIVACLEGKSSLPADLCQAAFHVFDRNRDGKISREELREVLVHGRDKSAVGERVVNEAIREADKNGDGKIDLDEFVKMMQGGLSRL